MKLTDHPLNDPWHSLTQSPSPSPPPSHGSTVVLEFHLSKFMVNIEFLLVLSSPLVGPRPLRDVCLSIRFVASPTMDNMSLCVGLVRLLANK